MLVRIASIACLLHAAVAVQVQVQHLGAAGNCTCLGWRKAYAQMEDKCGFGDELQVYGGSQAMNNFLVTSLFCSEGYQKLRGNTCIKKGFGTSNTHTWCYVSSQDCRDPKLETAEGVSIAKHTCTPDQDSVATKTFPELVAFAKEQNMDLLIATFLAYPQYQGWEGLKWNDVSDFFVHGTKPTNPKVDTRDLQNMIDSGEPVLFGSSDDHPEHVVVEGGNIYQLMIRRDLLQKFESKEGLLQHWVPYDFQLPKQDLMCLKGDCSAAISCFEGRTC